ncbi:response regulator transcription factor [Streptomyces sp. NPDC050560]|uniref:response regulator transcription factor n=1 Tax=Streptomyces sp. NPDC050560 TaxID=3365630 RepID=UPI0037986E09
MDEGSVGVGEESVRVSVVARSEVARGGLAAMLARAGHVQDYAVFRPEEFTGERPEDAIQLLILSSDLLALWCGNGCGQGDEAWAVDLAAVVRRNGVRVVLVLPRGEPQRATVPCDGVLDQDTLTTAGLDEAVVRVAGGETLRPEPRAAAAPRQAAPAVRGGADASPPRPRALLTEREKRVVELLAEGLSNRQIGVALGVSEHVAKRTLAIVLSKLDCPNRTQAVAVALSEGLVGSGEALRT